MIKIISASADTYITNRIVSTNFRAKDANVGDAGTLDLFKMFDESVINGESEPIEISRVLLKFDLNPIRALTGSLFDTNSATFKCKIKIKDVYGGQTTPKNFSLILHPLSKSFDEGIGRDIIRFSDVQAANFLTASYANGVLTKWTTEGAGSEAAVGSATADIISAANFGAGEIYLPVVQSFNSEEDLVMDVTQIVSGTLAGYLPDCGFRIAFSGSQETDSVTRFVKRFVSRHSASPSKRPRLEVSIDDSVIDNHSNMIFNRTGSLFLRNNFRGTPANFVSGSSASEISGANCMLLKIRSGSFSQTVTASQAKIGSILLPGLYNASFAVDQFHTGLIQHLKSTTSASFSEAWGSIDGTVAFYSGSFDVKTTNASAYKPQTRSLYARVTNCRADYKLTDRPRFILFIEDLDEEVTFSRYSRENNGHIYDRVYYSVRDAVTNDVVIPYMTDNGATRVSTSQDGMYFDFHMDALTPGRTYKFAVLIRDIGEDLELPDVSAVFRVTS